MQHNTTLLILDEEDNSLCMETDAILGLISIRLTSSEEVVHAISDVSCTDSVPGCGKAAAPTHCSVLTDSFHLFCFQDTVMVNCLKSGMPVQSKIFEFEM